MAGKTSRVLVIDASIAHAAGGEDAVYPTSANCREFLKAVLSICHRMAMSPAITEEWNRHQSNFARRWRVSMTAKKKIVYLGEERNDALRSKVEQFAASEKDSQAMLKDVHLIEAAQAAEQIVVSLDETVRALFKQASRQAGELGNVIWVNPDKSEERALAWLEHKARLDKWRRLGYRV
jgi:hypothetical protein